VFLARALAQDARLYLMDEPFAGVDATTERAIVELLAELRRQGRTVVCVHHDLDSAAEHFDWVVMLNRRLIAQGPTGDVFTVENLQATYGGVIGAALRSLQHQPSSPASPGVPGGHRPVAFEG
jgi:manganese/zinc/iron transport system ATP- binding protein